MELNELLCDSHRGHRELKCQPQRPQRAQRKKNFSCKTVDMIKEETLNSWEDFEKELVTINERAKVLQQEGKLSRMEYPLFRGVSDSEYHIETTLDRIKKEMSFSDYE